jgi:hypothetical protein
VNVIFLIEGEEESGSNGFLEAITAHQVTKTENVYAPLFSKLFSIEFISRG